MSILARPPMGHALLRTASAALLLCLSLGCDQIVGIHDTKVSSEPETEPPAGNKDGAAEQRTDARSNADSGADRANRADGAASDGLARDGGLSDGASPAGTLDGGTDVNTQSDAASPDVTPPDAPPPPCPTATATAQLDTFTVTASGNCSFPKESLPVYAASVDSELYGDSQACGACIELASALGKVVAQVVEHTPVQPNAKGNKISLNRAAMDLVAPGQSTATSTWRWVPCPLTGPITAALKDESSAFGWEIIVQNHVNRVTKLEFHSGDLVWTEVKRETYNYFHKDPAKGLPQQLRLTDASGNVVVSAPLHWPTKPVTMPISLDVQFPPACTY
jgi:hypothetical protein